MIHQEFRSTLIILVVIMLAGNLPALAQDHQHQHDHAAVPEMDADGKRLESYQVKHDMDAETLNDLRARIAVYRGLTDRELNMNMSAMGPNYEWYASDLSMRGDIGILILSHGVGENSDRMLIEALKPISSDKPTAVGFGMAMMKSSQLQSAVDDLTERGAKQIVVVPNGTTTPYNTLTRQWKYIFDMGEEATYLEVPIITSDATFHMTDHFGDNQLITDILYDHIKEVSKNPANEMIMIIGHGPEDNEDNVPDLEILGAHVERLKAKNEFADVKIANLQDDALAPIRKANVKRIRRWMKKADDKGQDVIVIAIAAASHGVQTHIRTDLRGLNYTFADKGMSEHPKYVLWIESVIDRTIASL
jgi:hypothetical protein